MDDIENITGTCQVCGQQVRWRCSTLDPHEVEGVRCAGTYKVPVETITAPPKRMTKQDRETQRLLFG